MSDFVITGGILSFREFLEFERERNHRYEFYMGQVFEKIGASDIHNEITGNTWASLKSSLQDKPCKTYLEGVKLEVIPNSFYVYPDVMVTCNPEDAKDRYIKRNPVLLAEVLSKSTAIFDTSGRKFLEYLKLPSLEYYLIISQNLVHVGVYTRLKDGWMYKTYEGLDKEIPLEKLEAVLKVAEIYADVDRVMEPL